MTVEVVQKAEWDDGETRAAKRQSLVELGDKIVELAGHLNAGNYRFLMLIAEWDRRKGWGGDGATASCAHWLNWRCGIDMGACEEMPRPETPADVSAETPNTRWRMDGSARKVDALAMMAETFLAQGAAALKGGDCHQIVVHVDAETLRDSTAGRCQFEDGPSVSAETCRRLSCDCSIVPILENQDGEPLNVGRKTRSIPPALHRALKSRDRGCCRFPGCQNTRFLDGHHIKHSAHGGETKLSNLVSLCRHHHRQVHEGSIVVHVLDDGAIRFTTPAGKSFDSTLPDRTQPLADWHQLVATHEEQGIHIDRHTAASRLDWAGYDHGMAVDSLLRRALGSAGPPTH